jgi:putative two-component system response regulator
MRVQIVDDNPTNLHLFRSIIKTLSSDVVVECHLDPVAALESCRQALPDLILVDYMMPRLNGHEYIAELRRMPKARDVPIVMITAANDTPVRHRALDLGATDFVTTPVDVYEMKARLANLLELRRSSQGLRDHNQILAEEVAKATSVIAQREHELIVRLSKAAEFRDPETGAHISRMANYSLIIAEGLRLTAEECDLILQSAPMHDVGKLGIPDGILLKPGKLDADEFAIMQTHTTIGHAILRDSSSQLIALGAEIALTHHEKFDGSGYPAGLAGETIPLPGRIVAVADVFDALTSERPYKPAWTVERARALLEENRGSHFDPACVDAFLADWERALEVRERFADEQPAKG